MVWYKTLFLLLNGEVQIQICSLILGNVSQYTTGMETVFYYTITVKYPCLFLTT